MYGIRQKENEMVFFVRFILGIYPTRSFALIRKVVRKYNDVQSNNVLNYKDEEYNKIHSVSVKVIYSFFCIFLV